MIDATAFWDGRTASLKLHGHAADGAPGKNILCAAASMLGYTAAQNVATAQRDGLLCRRPKLKLEPGNIEIEASPRREATKEVRHIFYVVESGLRLLAKNYPDQISVHYRKE